MRFIEQWKDFRGQRTEVVSQTSSQGSQLTRSNRKIIFGIDYVPNEIPRDISFSMELKDLILKYFHNIFGGRIKSYSVCFF